MSDTESTGPENLGLTEEQLAAHHHATTAITGHHLKSGDFKVTVEKVEAE